MDAANGKLTRLSREELSTLTQAPRAKSRDEKQTAVRKATKGLRVDVRITPRLYGRG